jgi:hypothetical protein
LRTKVIPALERFPRLGYDLLACKPGSAETALAAARLAKKMGKRASLGECVFGDYLVLYAVRSREMCLLAIRHHRELSFDLRTSWSE